MQAPLGCQREAQKHSHRALESCRLAGTSAEAKCTRVSVPESRDPSIASQRDLSLRVVVVPALATSPAPDPLFVLAGGPGQSAVELASVILPLFERVRRRHDIVFVDQRGTGDSHPLQCEGSESAMSDPFATGSVKESLAKCLASLDADTRTYTTTAAADDLDDVRKALGYSTINLWGGSYGTRLALVFARQHPTSVRTITLDGVAPVDMHLPLTLAEDSQRSLDIVLDHCSHDESCSKRFPQVRAQLDTLLGPRPKPWESSELARLTSGHPRLDHDAIAGSLRALLYRAESAAMIPFVIDAMSREGDHRALVMMIKTLVRSTRHAMSEGLFFSVICAEDVPTITEDELNHRAANTFLGANVSRSIVEGCSAWKAGTPPPGFHAPVRSEAPVLILSGEQDPATPPPYAERVAATLPHSVHAVFPNVGHGASPVGCAPQLIAQLIESGTTEKLDVSCARQVPAVPFVTSIQGSPP
ncbi:MAG: alpha/beta hydrolase [Polyangiaceae bacterium]